MAHPEASTSRGHAIAWLLLGGVAAGLFSLFVQPHLLRHQDLDVLHAQLRTTDARYRAAIAGRPTLEAMRAEITETLRNGVGYLESRDRGLASAELAARFAESVARAEGCAIMTQRVLPATLHEPHARVAISARLQCDAAELGAVLYQIEGSRPYVFVDKLTVLRGPAGRSGPRGSPSTLDVSVEISAFLPGDPAV
ncbi:MAG: type II secretion system protein GspM [Pseudomonadota bacterium]